MSRQRQLLMRERQRMAGMKGWTVIEPTIGPMKREHRLEINRLNGACGDAMNALLSGVAINVGKLLEWIVRSRRFFRAAIGVIFCWDAP